jgi:hypothetical protein
MKKVILALLMFALVGCDQAPKVSEEEMAAVKEADAKTGMVLETMDVEPYTYIRLDMQGQEVWLASTPVSVAKGELIRYSGEMVMQDFYSKTLDRTFPFILFVNGVQPVEAGAPTLSEDLAAAPDVTALHNNMGASAVAVTEPVVVEKLEGGMSIAEIIAAHEQMEGQEVSLRARVIKFSENILGMNWITLQDGTGTAPDNKLVVTSSEVAVVGDEVVVKGLVKNNVDIGAGYTYKVLLEEASFTQ